MKKEEKQKMKSCKWREDKKYRTIYCRYKKEYRRDRCSKNNKLSIREVLRTE
jgi:hypothetical protein